MMRLLAATGRRAAALAQYQACRQALADELAVEPERQTTQLYHQIRAQTEPPIPAQPGSPPAEPPPGKERPGLGDCFTGPSLSPPRRCCSWPCSSSYYARITILTQALDRTRTNRRPRQTPSS